MLISVIVPVYNNEKYLDECIQSIINQTYKNLEILLIDDGSTDNSGKICDNYAIIDSRIKVFHKENGGPASAHKLGISKAQGDYLAFVDSDDYIAPEAYKEMMQKMINYDCDLIACGYILKSNTEKENRVMLDQGYYCGADLEEKIKPYLVNSQSISNLLPYSIIFYIRPNKLFKRQIIVDNLNLYKDNIFFIEDYSLLVSVYCDIKSLYILDKSFYYYRDNSNSFTKKYKVSDKTDIERYIDFSYELINNKHITDTQLLNQLALQNIGCIVQLLLKVIMLNMGKKQKIAIIKDILKNKKFRQELKKAKGIKGFKKKILILLMKAKLAKIIYFYYKGF